MTTMTMKEAAQTALDVQNACNLQAVLAAWARCQPTIRDAQFSPSGIEHNVGGTARRHPVNVMFLAKVASMMVVATDCLGGVYEDATIDSGKDLFREAYAECQRLATAREGAVVEGVRS